MIRPSYAYELAHTKLRSKRGILITSIIVSSLMFSALIASIIVFTAAEKSALSFIKAAGNDKYLVQVSPNIPVSVRDAPSPLSVKDVDEIKAFEKKYYDAIRQKYVKAGVSYDSSTEVPILKPNPFRTDDSSESARWMVDYASPATTAWLTEKLSVYAKTAPNTYDKLKDLGAKYGATGYYGQTSTAFPTLPQSRLIEDGKEDFSSNNLKSSNPTSYGYLINAAYNSNYQFRDDSLVDRYLLTKSAKSLKGIPVIITAQEAASLFGKEVGIESEPKRESDKRKWLKDIQEKLNGHTYQACTRNSAEQAMIAEIQQNYTDIEKNKGTPNYKEPSLQLQLPSSACGDITVKKDTRTQAEKSAQNKTDEEQKKLGLYVAPAHYLTTFQIVGIMNAQPFSEYSTSVESYIKNLLSPQDDSFSAVVPTQLYEQLPDSLKFNGQITAQADPTRYELDNATFVSRVLEFNSIDKARAFLSNEACPSHDLGCAKSFYADPYGSNYLILDEIGKLFRQILTVALPVFIGMALIIMWFTISRIMAENRKETAVYRAMGAKRIDITAIYTIYTLLIAARISAISFIFGIGTAYVVDRIYGSQLTDTSLSAFGIISNHMRFSLFDLSSPLLLGILGLIFAVSIIACIQPLIRNVMRPPIRDMREE